MTNKNAEISTFSAAVRAAGYKLIPAQGSDDRRDADRIRAVATYLGIENPNQRPNPTIKKWWYGQNAPAKHVASLILQDLAKIANEAILLDLKHGPDVVVRKASTDDADILEG